MHLTLTGDLGSGKSTVAKILLDRLGLTYYSTGSILRKMAEENGISILEMNERASKDKTIDKQIDDATASLADSQVQYLVDSRLAWHFLPKSFKVKLKVDAKEAAKRVLGDKTRSSAEKYVSEEDAFTHLIARRKEEVRRFKEIYKVDIEDDTQFDLVIDTTNISPEKVANLIEEKYKENQVVCEKH